MPLISHEHLPVSKGLSKYTKKRFKYYKTVKIEYKKCSSTPSTEYSVILQYTCT